MTTGDREVATRPVGSAGTAEAPRSPAEPPGARHRPGRPRTIRELRLARLAARSRRPRTSPPTENPLRTGLRLERVPDPSVFVLFGATGDLAHRKVFPALAQLWRTNLLPTAFRIVAVARRPYTDETFRAEVARSLEANSRVPLEPDERADVLERIEYLEGDFDDPTTFDRLSARLDEIDRRHGTEGNRLYYLATQPSAFPIVVAQLGRAGLDHERHEGGWRRIVIEKPFGRDLTSAIRLNREVGKVFRESQVYRIDHYLGKETVRNLLVFRFGNGIFEPIWNRRYVDHVQITVAESIGIESRGRFYEETGASRDILQNHLMQLLALVAMEPPASFEADALRDEKVKVVRAVNPFTAERVARDVVRGQYGPGWVAGTAVPGYREEPGVEPGVGDRDLHRRPPRGRHLALVGRPLLPPERQAPPEAGDGDRDPVPGGPPPPLPGGERRPRAEPPRDADPAGRGDPPPLRGKGAGARPRHPGRDDGLLVRRLLQRRRPRRLRDPHPRRPLGRRLALHPGRRGRGSLADRDPDHRGLDRRSGAGLPELRRRDLGAAGGRGPRRPGRPTLAEALDGRRPAPERSVDRRRLVDEHDRQRVPGQPVLRWQTRAKTIEEIERELRRIWAEPVLTTTVDGVEERHVAARTSVMNLVVVARRPELGERAAATIAALTGRHPSRTIVLSALDPDGPAWLDARIEAVCVLPREDVPEMCSEFIYLRAGGEAGRRLGAIVTPLLIHDLPVTLWWPGNPPFETPPFEEALALADRLIVDGSGWSGDGLDRLAALARLGERDGPAIFDFAFVRQSRWREAIAAAFDLPVLRPFVRSLRRIAVSYASRDRLGRPGTTNVVKPVYHVAWLASRLGRPGRDARSDRSTAVPREPARRADGREPEPGAPDRAGLRGPTPRRRSSRSTSSSDRSGLIAPDGTTLRLELLAERRGSELRVEVTGEAEAVHVRAWQDGIPVLDRLFRGPRRTDVDLLAEAIETPGRDRIAVEALRAAGRLLEG
ncbi:MAG: hypothetical protein KatS3mg065_0084 [Chloroflexota bacterium]|nr:MAG: hypothetical protein KatS3mg065_0084 [Chloroflexota bacterium]